MADSWRRVSIVECDEPLVDLSRLGAQSILLRPRYYRMRRAGAIPKCLAREGVARLLTQAAAALPSGHRLVIWDAWRPQAVQEALYEAHYRDVARAHPKLPAEQIAALASRYVSRPSTDSCCPAPHTTGGAVDLTVADGSGSELPMGTDFDDFSAAASTDFFDAPVRSGRRPSDIELRYRRNRRMLLEVMASVGFTNYAEEWWHFDYGNQFWASERQCHAIYGMVHPGAALRRTA